MQDLARELARASRAPNTWKAYQSDWRAFLAWCDCHARAALPADPATLELYVTDLVMGRKAPASLDRYLASIAVAHQAAALESPITKSVRALVRGYRRRDGSAQRRVQPATTDIIIRLVAGLTTSPIDTRDRAMVLVGFAGALRRQELADLRWSDIREVPEGLVITLRRRKCDQEGKTTEIAIPRGNLAVTCPVHAVRNWSNAIIDQCWRLNPMRAPGWYERNALLFGDDSGPFLRTVRRSGTIWAWHVHGNDIARRLKELARRAGLDPRELSGHSLRAGLATSASAAGVPEHVIAQQTGHRSAAVLRRYIRHGSLFVINAAGKVGL